MTEARSVPGGLSQGDVCTERHRAHSRGKGLLPDPTGTPPIPGRLPAAGGCSAQAAAAEEATAGQSDCEIRQEGAEEEAGAGGMDCGAAQ